MAVYKDKKRGTWYVSLYYTDWTGKQQRKLKRGFSTKKEAQDWERHFSLEKASSLDMTFAFVGEFYEDYDEMQKMASKTAEVSHNHPEGIKGAVVTATCIWMAKHGKSKQEIYDYVLSEYPVDLYEYSIGYSLNEIRPRYKWNESCQGSVPAAMRCFYESTDYESFMRNIYSLPCDSDTFGAIAGGVAEEFYHGFGDIDAQGIFKKHLSDDLYEILMR